jgi:hypothetical protein
MSLRAGWVFLLLLALYLLIYSGRFHSIDEVSSVALADSLWLQGKPITDQIGWSQSWSLPQGTYGVDGHLYSKKGIGHSLLLLPFQWGVRSIEGVGVVGMAHLANALVTALTGAFFYGLVWQVSRVVGDHFGLGRVRNFTLLGTVLSWGIGTFAVVYSKYLFNSPIVGLCFVLVVSILFWMDQCLMTTRKHWAGLIVAGSLVGFSLIARAENALVVPVFAAYLWFAPVSYRIRLFRLLAFGLPIVVTVLFLFYLNWSRFGEFLNFGYDLSQEANGNILVGLAGFLVSPGRSLLLMMPLLIPATWGWVRLAKHSPTLQRLAWLVLGLTIVYALFFARSADWWGGWNWGIRYFLPLLPLWCIGLLGMWEYAFALRRYPLAGTLIWLAIILSVGVQLLGVLVDFNRPLLADAANNIALDAQLWGWEHSQLVSHIRYLSEWQRWDLLSVAVQEWQLAWQPFALLILAMVGLFNAHLPYPNPFYQYSLPFLLIILMQWSAVPMQQSALKDPVWEAYRADLAPLNEKLANAPDNSVLLFEMLLYRPYFDRAQAWLNLGTNQVPHLELIQENEPPIPQQRLRDIAIADANHIYVAVEGTAIGDPNSSTERWMSQRAHYAGTEWVSENTRLTTFYTTEPLSLTLENQNLSDNLSLREVKATTNIAIGQPLFIELTWGATGIPSQDYTVFVQLLRPDGTVAAQQDNAPQAGFAPTSQWQAGTDIIDRRALPLPADLAPGDYTLIVGMYDGNGARLKVATGGDFITGATIKIEEELP